jgi:hypothetical protein
MTGAYELGQQAFLDGAQDNPYEEGSEAHEDWIQGWQQQWWEAVSDEDTGNYE